MKRLGVLKDSNNENMVGRNYSDFIGNAFLAANTEKTVTIPTGASFVIMRYTGVCYVRIDGTVIVPTTDITDGTGGELNPELLKIYGATAIHIISASAGIVSLSWYADK